MHTRILLTLFLSIWYAVFLSAQDVRIAVIGDFGAASLGATTYQSEAAVANLVKSWDTPDNPLDAIITTGDNNYPNGLAADIETNIGQFYGEYILGHPNFTGGNNRFFPCIGNHDYGTSNCHVEGDASPYLNYFTLPNNELYYDYVIGNVHFFVLDSDCHQSAGTNPYSEQAAWLENKMTNSPHPWKIVYFHHAPFGSVPNGGSGNMDWDFKEWGASAVFSGHYHVYERLQVDGLTYFINGIGGTSIYDFEDIHPNSLVRYNQKHGAMLLTISGGDANFKTINIDYQVIDEINMQKEIVTNPSDCNTISGHTKLGDLNGHSYFISNNKAAGWHDARNKSIDLGGNLVAIETEAEKEFIDQKLSSQTDENVVYIGLKRNNSTNFDWTNGEPLNLNNFNNIPWENNTSPTTGNFTTLRKWNAYHPSSWGTESGNAYRKYILEKQCESEPSCSGQGGDSDGDGICNNEDCQIWNPTAPAAPNTPCDDNNANTTNDIIQSDGCTCLGQPIATPNNTCTEITNYTRLGDFNGKAYFHSNFKAQGWQDAMNHCIAQGGRLVSIEDQVEKNKIDEMLNEMEGNSIYIGLKRDESGIFKWASGELLNLNNFYESPWEGGVNPTTGNYTTLRKWSTNDPVWGTESGGAYRTFILEKTCNNTVTNCANQGGDTDGDGICDTQDCKPYNPTIPAPLNSPCDDGDENTVNDRIQSNECICQGDVIISSNPCDELEIKTGTGSIMVNNIQTPIAIIKIYNSEWEKIFECKNNCYNSIEKAGLLYGVYYIDIQLFDASWESVCLKTQFVTVYGGLESSTSNQLKISNLDNKTKHLQLEQNISLYPNPTSEKLFVRFANKEKKVEHLQVFDTNGRLVQQSNYNSMVDDVLEIDTHQLLDGMYLLSIKMEGSSFVSKRFIVRK